MDMDLENEDTMNDKVDEYSQDTSSDSALSEEDRELLADNIKIGEKRARSIERDSDDELEHMFDDEEALVHPNENEAMDIVEYDEDEDDMRDFIEESESEEEHRVVEKDLNRHIRPSHKSPWLDRGLSRETLHDLMDIFGDGSEYVDLVLSGIRRLSLKKAEDVQAEERVEPEHKIIDQEIQIDESALPWLTHRLCSLCPDKFNESAALQETVATVFSLLRSGLTPQFIAFHRKEYISDMNINDIWTLSDEMRRWSQINRKKKLLLHAHLGVVDQLHSLNLDPLDHFIDNCMDEDVLEVCNEFLSELRRSSRGKGKFANALNAHFDISFCPSPFQFFDCLRKNIHPDNLQLNNAPSEIDEGLSTYLVTLFSMHPVSYQAIRDSFSPCITVTPTTKGAKIIDNRHVLAPIKYLTRKPIDKFRRDEFMILAKAQNDDLLTISTEFLDRSRTMDRLLDAVPRFCERILRSVIEDLLSTRISKQVHVNLKQRSEDWLAHHLQFALQDRLTSPPLHRRIVAFTVNPDESIVAAVYLDESGTVCDTLHQNYSQSPIDYLITFIQDSDPEMILVSGRHCAVYDDYYELQKKDLGYSIIFSEDDTARSCHDSARVRAKFHEHPSLVRYCIGVASRAHDPLLEFSKLTDDELLELDLHPQQSFLNREIRLRFLLRAITNAISVVGLDLSNKDNWNAIRHLLEPRSASKLIAALPNVVTRSDMQQSLDPIQFKNIASFIFLPDSDEPLDRTRIHPEDYAYARKMAADALGIDEYDEKDEDVGKDAINRIIRKPAPLDQLAVSEYARELASRFNVSKSHTLLNIRSELNNPFKDLRTNLPAAQMTPIAILQMLSGVKADTLIRGQLVTAKLVRGRPYDALLEPSHLQALFIENTRYPHSSAVFKAAISAIIPENMLVHLSIEPVDLAEPRTPIYGPLDHYYDQQRAFRHLDDIQQQQQTPKGAPPVMAFTQHPLYRVCTKGEAERSLSDATIGHAIVRPSRTYGPDHFALTWKVDENVFQHVDLKKVGSRFAIDDIFYNSIDEIIGRYVEPILGFLAEVRACLKFFADGRVEKVEAHLASLRQSDPNRIAYCLSLSSTFPGTVNLSYFKGRVVHENVLVLPSGFRFRKQQFERLELFINWFKTHFNDKTPQPPSSTISRDVSRAPPISSHSRSAPEDRGHQSRLPDYGNRRHY